MTKLTPKGDWKGRFLAALEEKPIIARACKKANISREHAYNERERDEEFAQAWKSALETAVDSLVEKAWDRAAEESDVLIRFLLSAHRPEVYRETQRHEHTGDGGGPLKHEHEHIYRGELEQDLQRRLARRAAAQVSGGVAEEPDNGSA